MPIKAQKIRAHVIVNKIIITAVQWRNKSHMQNIKDLVSNFFNLNNQY